MKKLLFITLISVLFSCQNSSEKLSDLKSQFTKETPDIINIDNMEELELNTVSDEQTVALIGKTIYPGKSDFDLQEIVGNSKFHLFSYTSINEKFDRYMVVQERGCKSTLFCIITDK
ncbi:MAG: hypothetical protein AAFQ94_31535, partial [Bacteroidota bacterium]